MSNQAANTVYVYVDESGTITTTDNSRYFVIAMLFTDDPSRLRHYFKDKISQLMRRKELFEKMVKIAKEIKGSDISETNKSPLYEHIIKHAASSVELGVIVLDNHYATPKFLENHARAFNYMIQVYLTTRFRNHSKFMRGSGSMDLIIDEQNIATNAPYTLEGYLNQQLTMCNPVCDSFSVKYVDSKSEKLVQCIDWIANSFYRNIEKKNGESKPNIALWLPYLCHNAIFNFFNSPDVQLNL